MKKIGIYGGTFDPIHIGHLNLAFELSEKKGLDEVWFIPAQINPFKTHTTPTSIQHRLNMLHLAIKGIPQFQVKDIESQRPPPSYTVDTIRTLIAEEKIKNFSNQFYLLLGEDSVQDFFQWHLPEEIVKMVPLLVGSRSGNWQTENQGYDLSVREAIKAGMIKTRLMDVSSSEIRERLKNKLYCGHLIPSEALKYIEQNQLYPLN